MKMNEFRKSLFTRATCLLLAFTFLMISCSPESTGVLETSTEGNCTYVVNDLLTNTDVANTFENALELARTIHYQEGYTDYAEFHGEVFGKSGKSNPFVDLFESESTQYQSLGFESYLSSKEEISESLTNYFISYSSNLKGYLLEEEPTLEELESFLSIQKSHVLNSELCEMDKELMSFYLDLSEGYAQYYYKHYYDASNTGAGLRGCGFFKAIVCGLLALVVTTAVTVAAVFVASFVTVTFQGHETNDGFVDLASLALGVYVGIDVYKWCCGRDKIDEQECEEPTNSMTSITSCGEAKIRLWGPSTYGPTEWTNVNANPSVVTTNLPSLVVTVPSPGTPTVFNANVSCVESSNAVTIFEWEEEVLFEFDQNYFPLEWGVEPPPYFAYFDESDVPPGDIGFENLIYAQTNTPSSDVFTYSWSVNSPHQIISGGQSYNNSVTIMLNGNETNLTTTVTATNNCSNETETISKTTEIL